MSNHANIQRRGLTLLELILALIITTVVSGAILGMMGAISVGVNTRRDSRTTMVSANAAGTRLSAYIAPARCILAAEDDRVVLWLNDDRPGQTVHASEVRWICFDDQTGVLELHYLAFPEAWTQTARDLEDAVARVDTDWWSLLDRYESRGLTNTLPLVEQLVGTLIETNTVVPLDSEHITFTLSFKAEIAPVDVLVPATIRLYRTPLS